MIKRLMKMLVLIFLKKSGLRDKLVLIVIYLEIVLVL